MSVPAADDFTTIKENLDRIRKENDDAIKRDPDAIIPKVKEPEYYGGEYCDHSEAIQRSKYGRGTTFTKDYVDHNKKAQGDEKHPYGLWFKDHNLQLDKYDQIITTHLPLLMRAFSL